MAAPADLLREIVLSDHAVPAARGPPVAVAVAVRATWQPVGGTRGVGRRAQNTAVFGITQRSELPYSGGDVTRGVLGNGEG